MENKFISIGEEVRHKTKFLNGNILMNVSEIKDDQALCEHFEPDTEGGTTHKKSWFPIEELGKVIYGNTP